MVEVGSSNLPSPTTSRRLQAKCLHTGQNWDKPQLSGFFTKTLLQVSKLAILRFQSPHKLSCGLTDNARVISISLWAIALITAV
jgi:hypothetical protein